MVGEQAGVVTSQVDWGLIWLVRKVWSQMLLVLLHKFSTTSLKAAQHLQEQASLSECCWAPELKMKLFPLFEGIQ